MQVENKCVFMKSAILFLFSTLDFVSGTSQY